MKADSETLAYILGVIKTDGSVYEEDVGNNACKVQLLALDKEFIDKFSDALEEIGLNPSISITDKISDDYSQDELYVCKATSQTFHDWYKQMTDKELIEMLTENRANSYKFIEGAYEGDGTLARVSDATGNPQTIKINTSDRNLLSVYREVLNYLDIDHEVYTENENKGYGNGEYHHLVIGRQEEILKLLININPCQDRKKGTFDSPAGKRKVKWENRERNAQGQFI